MLFMWFSFFRITLLLQQRVIPMRRTLSLLVLSVVAVFSISSCGGVKHNITITAPENSDLCGLYVSDSGADAFGENTLKDGAVLAAKESTSIVVETAGNYDVKLETCDGREEVMPIAVP